MYLSHKLIAKVAERGGVSIESQGRQYCVVAKTIVRPHICEETARKKNYPRIYQVMWLITYTVLSDKDVGKEMDSLR